MSEQTPSRENRIPTSFAELIDHDMRVSLFDVYRIADPKFTGFKYPYSDDDRKELDHSAMVFGSAYKKIAPLTQAEYEGCQRAAMAGDKLGRRLLSLAYDEQLPSGLVSANVDRVALAKTPIDEVLCYMREPNIVALINMGVAGLKLPKTVSSGMPSAVVGLQVYGYELLAQQPQVQELLMDLSDPNIIFPQSDD